MTTEITILGELGFDVTAPEIIDQIRSAPDQIRVVLDSPGGSVSDAISIYTALRAHPYVVTIHVMGHALSGGSIIMCAGDRVEMDSNAAMMLHSAWTELEGNAAELASQAKLLRKIDERMVRIYAEKSGIEPDVIGRLLEKETWLSPEECVRYGFADQVVESVRIAAGVRRTRGAAKLFHNLVNARVRRGVPRGQALRTVAKKNPRLHAMMLLETNQGKDPYALNDIRERGGLRTKQVRRVKSTRRRR